jgi:hypothetical protein
LAILIAREVSGGRRVRWEGFGLLGIMVIDVSVTFR